MLKNLGYELHNSEYQIHLYYKTELIYIAF